MPPRKTPLVNNEFYHVINRAVFNRPIFITKRDCQRALDLIKFYRNANLPCKYSRFLTLPKNEKLELYQRINQGKDSLVEIIAFCLMPNHYHFLVKQIKNNGIIQFISNFSNSYAKYFNIKRKQNGPLFQSRFKAIRIETNEQLIHVSRYLHLNPHTAYIVKNLKELKNYPYSSFIEYLGKTKESICHKELLLSQFESMQDYKRFVFDNADYQRELAKIKHLLLEKS